MQFIIRACITGAALLLATYIIPGFSIDSVYTALVAALFIGITNALIRPVLIVLTFPITILTLGLFIFVINAGILLVVASFVPGFSIAGFWSALFASLFVSIVTGIAHSRS